MFVLDWVIHCWVDYIIGHKWAVLLGVGSCNLSNVQRCVRLVSYIASGLGNSWQLNIAPQGLIGHERYYSLILVYIGRGGKTRNISYC